jgi:diaminopimelate epimerase
MMEPMGTAFLKGHATGNDFVVLPDPDGTLDLPPSRVAALCDRRRGIGGDGVLRVVRTAAVPEVADDGRAEWFMDYRNADGSLADMCGNGVRLYAHYLVDSGLAQGPRLPILTRAGLVTAEIGPGRIAVDMPLPRVNGAGAVRLADRELKGTMATCGNPNLVCWVDDPDPLDLTHPLGLDPAAFPDSANVEFVERLTDRHVRMRVVERGVGETQSCGSGACAVAAVALADAGLDGEIAVDVPGGQLTVTVTAERCVLAGPAVIVASGTTDL